MPDADKLTDLREFLRTVGLKLEGGAHPEAKHYAEVLNNLGDRPDAHLIQTVMLRSMKQATYSPENIGHFGLAISMYAHFTSPIRRYPDLLVHRAIRHLIKGNTVDRFGETCSMTDRRADEATRDVESWLKCEYMMDKVGEEFDGIISGTTSFGIFVELTGIYVEGLVHVTSLNNDYYHFNPIKHCLVGERTQQSFCLADKVAVKVVRVDLDEKRIDFDLVRKYDRYGVEEKVTPAKSEKRRGKKGDRKKSKTKRSKKRAGKKTGKKEASKGGKKKKTKSRTKASGKKKTASKKKKTAHKKRGKKR